MSYQVINLLNYISKVVEKVVAIDFLQYCEDYSRLYLEQMRGQKKRSNINKVVILVYTV